MPTIAIRSRISRADPRKHKRTPRGRFEIEGPEHVPEPIGYLLGQEWRDCVSNLNVLLAPVTLEEIVIGKRLKAGSLPDGQAPTLSRIRMNVIVSILGDMTCDRPRRPCLQLDTEAICIRSRLPTPMIRFQRYGKLACPW